MKQRFLASVSALALGALTLTACSKAQPGGAAAQETPKGAAVGGAPATAVAAQAPASNPAQDPANARQTPKEKEARYEGGLEKLDTAYDLTKVDPQAGADAAGQEGHDRAAADAPVKQDGSSLTPAAQAQKYKAHFSMLEGMTETKDLGKLRQGDVANFDFAFVSDGQEPLVISGVKPSCGCTKAEIELLTAESVHQPYTKGDPIPVGQKFVLSSQINTDGRQGAFSATVAIYTNEVRGVFTARLNADIEPVLTITPSPSVYFGRITTADQREQVVTIATTRHEPFLLTLGQEVVQPPLSVVYVPKSPGADGKAAEWEVKLTLGPNAEIGMRNYPLNFKSDIPVAHPKYPSPDGSPQFHSFILNATAQVTGMVSAEPQFITFGMVRPGEPIERSFKIECHDDFKLSPGIATVFEGLQGQEFPFKELFKVTVQPQEDGRTADVKVRLEGMPSELNGSFGGVLKVKVGHPFMDEVLVRFSGVCRPGLPAAGAPKTEEGGK